MVRVLSYVTVAVLFLVILYINIQFGAGSRQIELLGMESGILANRFERIQLLQKVDPEKVSPEWEFDTEYVQDAQAWLAASNLERTIPFLSLGDDLPLLEDLLALMARSDQTTVRYSVLVSMSYRHLNEINRELREYDIVLLTGYSYLVMAQIIFILLLTMMVFFTLEERRVKAREIRDMMILQKRLTEIQEKERNRIALDLHDDIAQELAWLRLEMEQQDSMKSGGRLVERLIEKVRNLSTTLRVPDFTRESFRTAIDDIARTTEHRSPVRINFLPGGISPEKNPAVYGHVYRIFQELINNAGKHAGGCTVFIEIEEEDDFVYGTYRDNGRGFVRDLLNTSERLGYRNLSNRISLLKGTWKIETAPGEGLRIDFRLPLKENE